VRGTRERRRVLRTLGWLVDAAQAALMRGDVKSAALAYDAAVMIAEGT
jgi:hypothetical protein